MLDALTKAKEARAAFLAAEKELIEALSSGGVHIYLEDDYYCISTHNYEFSDKDLVSLVERYLGYDWEHHADRMWFSKARYQVSGYRRYHERERVGRERADIELRGLLNTLQERYPVTDQWTLVHDGQELVGVEAVIRTLLPDVHE